MSQLTLGLDIGPNSIGWALVDNQARNIVAAGVRVFPEGVDRDQQGGEKSKNQTRRTARAIRRQIARRNHRRRLLKASLAQAALFPSDPAAAEALMEQDPYELRRRALDEKLDPHEIGRIFLHLAQRRGFLSNRKTDKAADKETEGMLAEMSELDQRIEQSGSRTLGEYFARQLENFDHRAAEETDRARRWHTRRVSRGGQFSYEREFHAIWEAQQKHHPHLLTDALKYGTVGKQKFPQRPQPLEKGTEPLAKYGIYGLIFFQRKMYWPKTIIGRCELEPKHKRCPKADRAAQRFRILQEVNNLRLLDRSTGRERRLTDDERRTLIAYLLSAKSRTFTQIRKKLELLESITFNFERADRTRLKGHETDAALGSRKALGKRWKDLPAQTKDAIVDILLHEVQEDDARRHLVEDCQLTDQEADRALTVNLPEGYVNFSRLAIEKLLPHLERGLLLMADDASNSALHAAGYLRPDEREVRQRRWLPPAPDLPNPIVRQALVEVRKVVNSVLREHVYRRGGSLARIHVELAREAKKSFEERQQIRIRNAKRRRQREAIRAEIEALGFKPTRATINRHLLWQEQETLCVYCGQELSQGQLFNGDADVDHILPRWRSLDDSLANKVIAHRTCNAQKGDRTPREWLEEQDPQCYERMMQVIRHLPYSKQRKFQQKDIELTDFVERQLRDTAYISRCVTQYLRSLGARVICPRGQMTADLRHWWGLNTILDPDASGEKNRQDHRHHAIDALVIALTTDKRLFALANARGDNMPPPWKNFRAHAEQPVLAINVSHRPQGRLRGSLHEATLYGPTQKTPADAGDEDPRPWAKEWVEHENTYVRRKPVSELTSTKHLDKIRDKTIREILQQHLRDRGVDPDQPGNIPGDAFKGENMPRMPSGVPIKRVRMLEESETFRPVSSRRAYQYVKPGNNHHIVYRATGADDVSWAAEVVTTWEAARRARTNPPQPVVDRRDNRNGRFVMSLSIGEMFQMDGEGGERPLCVVRKIDQRSKRVFYKLHTDARQAAEINKDNLYLSPSNMRQRRAQKVTVDPLGRIRRAND